VKTCVTHHRCDCTQEKVDALESDVLRLREALTSIACLDKPKQSSKKYWMRLTKMQCAEVLATDTQIARETLKLLQVTYENNK
jgi:hypothetical protein